MTSSKKNHWVQLLSDAGVAKLKLATCASIIALSYSANALAHVNYIDLSDSTLSPNGTNGSTFSNYGWWAGTQTALGDSHGLAGGDFFKIHLDTDAYVSISFSDDSNSGALNPAFSLYSGLLPDEAHDDTSVDPLNPKVITQKPFKVTKIASPKDDGVTTDANGNVSPFRDTAHITYNGQFDALHSWSMGNTSGEWSVINYITSVGPQGGNEVSLDSFFLKAGDYTIAAAGGTAYSADTAITGLSGTLHFFASATPVPEPSNLILMTLGLSLMVSARFTRKQK